jgi:hypothetical protein
MRRVSENRSVSLRICSASRTEGAVTIAALVYAIVVAVVTFCAAFLVNGSEVCTSSAVAYLLTSSGQDAAGNPSSPTS